MFSLSIILTNIVGVLFHQNRVLREVSLNNGFQDRSSPLKKDGFAESNFRINLKLLSLTPEAAHSTTIVSDLKDLPESLRYQ